MTTPVDIQYVGQRRVDRSCHLWQRRVDNTYQCLLCGGLARTPTINEVCDKYEKLTNDQRRLAANGDASVVQKKRT